ncbi:hypothetical protein COCC4DRAFT_164732 [Bipolaris maydis ATCC 48331]|uniref:Fe2OG dioxygenase domain-containing protein n=2 Tax=Cochliobolus heterostrophus TaxID=5016 RepID=M2UIF7_COCH5|nr:uncharacterized protein COCC4DRAFT_164732 [Bipolaris maydis ATCC 48331]EMD93456.1 hypothetical protein COCHEDRAFT_1131788 [Bipolaris maydis C5]ENI07096.1 hypothetical protein COCC4DRAFT_164732 [Bipolaris maydis ATCC 48331]KAJ6204705.1 hypothetical protein PSV09DRAFT_1131788 [Bipolaris maydis]KAJ6266588.1 hypothetical protein PSV08DRAFT_412330 [Bipolaris maydis]
MSDMQAALQKARHKLHNSDKPWTTSPSLTPTSSPSPRSTNPISTAHSSVLPKIDISPFLNPASPPSSRLKTAQAINAACTTYGFFYLTGHGIPQAQLDSVISLTQQFFALPLDEKAKIERFDAGSPQGGDGARGYQRLCTDDDRGDGLQDLQEAVDFYAEWPDELREEGDGGPGSVKSLQGRNLWPEQPRGLRAAYEEYIARVSGVGEALVRAMGEALELEGEEERGVIEGACKGSFWVVRMIGYPPLPSPPASTTTTRLMRGEEEEQQQFSCGAHTDYGCVTLLLSDDTPNALQIQLKDGTWLNADPVPGAFVVNIGDMIERWTNGLWKSTLHRVIHRTGDRYRISVPFFYEPNFYAEVAPLETCVKRTGGKRVYESSVYGEHLLTKVFSNFYYSKRTDW